MDRIVALVPIRNKSERIKKKNIRKFDGKPLYFWTLQTLDNCQSINEVYIDTDSDEIKNNAPALSSKIKIINRPDHLCDPQTSMNDVLFHDVSLINCDYFLQTHVTNPMLRDVTIDTAVKTFFESKEHDSLFSVTRHQIRFWDALARPINHNPNNLLRTQELSPMYEENSNLYIFSRALMLEKKNRIGDRPLMFEIEREESYDIDNINDFYFCEHLHRYYRLETESPESAR